jgi:hypothetical protein
MPVTAMECGSLYVTHVHFCFQAIPQQQGAGPGASRHAGQQLIYACLVQHRILQHNAFPCSGMGRFILCSVVVSHPMTRFQAQKGGQSLVYLLCIVPC